MPVALRRGIGGDKARGCLRTAATAGSSKKDAADYRIDPTSPGYVDSNVAGEIPHKINTIAETGESPRVQHRTGVGINDLNGFGSYDRVPVHGVEGERMGVAVGQIDVKAKRAIAIPGCGNSPGTIPGLQSSRINGARSPRVVQLIFDGQGSIAWDALRVVGYGIPIGSVNAMPGALRRGIGGDKARGCLRTAATAGSSKKDAADYRIDPTSPGYVDSDVAGEIPHKINTIAETGESPRVQFQQWCLSCVESLRPRQNQRNLDWWGQCGSQRRLFWRSRQWRRYEGNRELYRHRYRDAR